MTDLQKPLEPLEPPRSGPQGAKPLEPPWLAPGFPPPDLPPGGAPAGQGETPIDSVGLATKTLQGICRDGKAPAAARAQAARTLLELSGALKSGAGNGAKPAAEMTVAEIDARLGELEHGADTGGKDTR